MKIGFIGAGNMASAILDGILSGNFVEKNNIYAYDVSKERCEIFAQKGVNISDDSTDLVKACDYIILAIKPQNFPEVMTHINDFVTEEKTLISIAAGISTDYIKKFFETDVTVFRAMPNLPMVIGCGATALCAVDDMNDERFLVAKKIFSLSSIVEIIPELKMNEIIAVNGSSPAYVYLFAKSMLMYAKNAGIDEKSALKLITASIKGSAEMIEKSEDDIDTLISRVSSKGGTTLAALDILYKNNFSDTVVEAMEACTKRAEELSK